MVTFLLIVNFFKKTFYTHKQFLTIANMSNYIQYNSFRYILGIHKPFIIRTLITLLANINLYFQYTSPKILIYLQFTTLKSKIPLIKRSH